ncbi:Dipeptide transport system permease protein DppB [Martelella mediterranea DSM 17316]|uniref:Dipeptide transport system permease protein DppB n=1 Tax=Martelella mediterranea DSM 17316 TaxID=1122214 RepID=A0A1U9YZ75_9HYPH|nr:ABC transporter permease [Martelella mediterranea]AQZ50745.1 Dipeptide transport system permease protein DppB [Martelella mediterranea DSM 17316]
MLQTRPAVRRIAGNLVFLAASLLAVSFIIFAVMAAVPGDPAEIMLGTSAAPDTLAALRSELGLDQPFLLRYGDWLAGLMHGDLGLSYTYSTPVAALIGERLAVTLPLAGYAVALSLAIALPLGVFAGQRPGGPVDIVATFFSQIGIAVPGFWIGLLLILGVALTLGWFPTGGFPGWQAGFLPAITALTLPAIALAIPQAAVLTRVTRTAVIEVAREDFVRTARAKGASRMRALWRHVVPNALIPVVTMLGMQISVLMAGTVLVENVFTLPGLGTLAYQALAQRDLIVIQNVALLFAVIVMGLNFAVDTLYAVIDPRLKATR